MEAEGATVGVADDSLPFASISLASMPDFSATRRVKVLNGTVVRLARELRPLVKLQPILRSENDRLDESAVRLDAISAAPQRATLPCDGQPRQRQREASVFMLRATR